jgi:hypothetical protein
MSSAWSLTFTDPFYFIKLKDFNAFNMNSSLVLISATLILFGCKSRGTADQTEWVSLFNGKDLSGWTVKISG